MDNYSLIEKLELNIKKINQYEEVEDLEKDFNHQRLRLIAEASSGLPLQEQMRIYREFEGLGPLEELINDHEVTEILLNGPEEIWVERYGSLQKNLVNFYSQQNYENTIKKILHESRVELTIEQPYTEASYKGFRVHAVRPPVSKKFTILSLRRHPENPWTLEKLVEEKWCSENDKKVLEKIVEKKWNFLVVGNTGSGKTSVINALLQKCQNDRSLILEDCSEIQIPNGPSAKLLTRTDLHGNLKNVTHSELLTNSLRLRPDRIILGEIRSIEAKDFLMAISTGHEGSFSSLHSHSAQQAILRLEMLVQMGAPQWSLQTIRRLIHMSLNGIIVTTRSPSGQRKLNGIYKISSLEENGIVFEPIDPNTTYTDIIK